MTPGQMPTSADAHIRLVEPPRVIPGFAFGLRHACLFVSAAIAADPRLRAMAQVNTWLDGALAETSAALPAAETPESCMEQLLHCLFRMQRFARVPVTEQGCIVGFDGKAVLAVMPMPAQGGAATAAALHWLIAVHNHAAAGRDLSAAKAELSKVLQQLGALATPGSNGLRFLNAARELGIPFLERVGGLYQFGYGARSRWLESSYTDQTSRIGAAVAHRKTLAAVMLDQAGVPAPRHLRAESAAAALKAAETLGYPVVVKPEDLDRGIGVAAGLTTPAQLTKAWEAARKHGRNVLVEKHFEGRDYRLVVFQDELIWAVERRPAGITGDGHSSVEQLVAQLNADPRRGRGGAMQQVALDDEALGLLREAGLGPQQVPATGRFLRLRRIANISGGGTPVAVFDQVHPDNRRLALRAAAAVRLDLCGVDLLIPDIARSWRETGALVCEVNGQPDLGQVTSAHLYPQILRRMLRDNGRVPVALVVGAGPGSTLAAQIAGRLRAAGLRTGLLDRHGASLDDELLIDAPVDVFRGGRALLTHSGVDAAVLCVDDASVFLSGLPIPRYDVLVLCGTHFAGATAPDPRFFRNLHKLVAPACDGAVFAAEGSAWGFLAETPERHTHWWKPASGSDALAESVASALLPQPG